VTTSGQLPGHRGPDVDRVEAHVLSQSEHGLLLPWGASGSRTPAHPARADDRDLTAWPSWRRPRAGRPAAIRSPASRLPGPPPSLV
jgi:hypothetical protein